MRMQAIFLIYKRRMGSFKSKKRYLYQSQSSRRMLMEEKFKKAIMAGIICGIILLILTLAFIIVEQFIFGSQLEDIAMKYSDSSYIPPADFSDIFNGVIIGSAVSFFILFALGILTFFGAGILAAKMASQFIKTRNDALIIGVVSGATAEIVHRPFTMVITFIADMIHPSSYYTAGSSTVLQALLNMGSQVVCCFPFVLIAGIVLAVIGSLIYSMVRLKV